MGSCCSTSLDPVDVDLILRERKRERYLTAKRRRTHRLLSPTTSNSGSALSRHATRKSAAPSSEPSSEVSSRVGSPKRAIPVERRKSRFSQIFSRRTTRKEPNVAVASAATVATAAVPAADAPDPSYDVTSPVASPTRPISRTRKSRFSRFFRRRKSLTEEDEEIETVDLGFQFPFENLVFEGGGNKGLAYVGALRVLEEVGVSGQVRRVAGASSGAMCACLFSVGFTSFEMFEFLTRPDARRILLDHSCGLCSVLPNLLSGFGWNPGRKILRWFGETLEKKTGNADITFMDVYKQYGRELCIVATNLNHMSVEYFHPKTTPNMPIRWAVRMSMSIPGIYQSVRSHQHGETYHYVDGGVLCNFPIHVFDGWWLSMKREDAYLRRIANIKDIAHQVEDAERFQPRSEKTIGLLLYSRKETEVMKTLMNRRDENRTTTMPRTKLAKRRNQQWMKKMDKGEDVDEELVEAVDRFFKVIAANDYTDEEFIVLEDLQDAFNETSAFTQEDAMKLFGHTDPAEAFKELDVDNDDEVTFQEIVHFIERKGVSVQSQFLGYSRREISGFMDFVSTMHETLSINVKKLFVTPKDLERTVGIDTDYIETTDWNLEEEDRMFLIEAGMRATRSFLREHLSKRGIDVGNMPSILRCSVNELRSIAKTKPKRRHPSCLKRKTTRRHAMGKINSQDIEDKIDEKEVRITESSSRNLEVPTQ
ncbi:uncharacterized protein [Oscarella lobularis]|uniref:uncharacterized protein n=1 Tax=Oscarella lobularis TaxID=121494 RepID=UPI00331416DD